MTTASKAPEIAPEVAEALRRAHDARNEVVLARDQLDGLRQSPLPWEFEAGLKRLEAAEAKLYESLCQLLSLSLALLPPEAIFALFGGLNAEPPSAEALTNLVASCQRQSRAQPAR
ncbi:MAG TPA: hypothetical protein VMT30_08445 [Candidatus Saccharimonadia bacterium]|nr:hypothetical protein [Candidatus Saccharimonadia bacterium]